MLEALKKYFWEKCCALYTKPTGSKKAEEEIDRIYNKGAYHSLWEQFQKANYAASELEKPISRLLRWALSKTKTSSTPKQEEDEDEET